MPSSRKTRNVFRLKTMTRSGFIPLLTIVALTTFTACGDNQHARELERAPGPVAAVDTSELARIYDTIDADHQQLITLYQQMAPQMDADVQQMVDYMAQMYGRAGQMHEEMMVPSGSRMMDRESMRHRMMDRPAQGRGMLEDRMMMQSQTREWDLQMRAMHGQMSQHMRQLGYNEMAALHERMMANYDDAAGRFQEEQGEAGSPSPPEGSVSGAEVYRQYCTSCHGADGQGLGSAFPPLSGSRWVTDDTTTPIRVVLHGLQGPIQVQDGTFDGTMPAFAARLSDAEVAAVLTYVRSQWGNNAPAVTAATVSEVREENRERTQPWTSGNVR